MIEYVLEDKHGNTRSLNGDDEVNSLVKNTLAAYSFNWDYEHKIRETSAGDGGVPLGDTRIPSNSLTITYTRANPLIDDYRDQENALKAFLRDVVKIIDETNGREARCRLTGNPDTFNEGTLLGLGTHQLNFTILDPVWFDVVETTDSLEVDSGQSLSMNLDVLSSAPVIPFWTITATTPTPSFTIYLNATLPSDRVEIDIDDPLFGTGGYEVMTIDVYTGDVLIGDDNRNGYIREMSDFFEIPIGEQEIVINPQGDITVELAYKNRSFY